MCSKKLSFLPQLVIGAVFFMFAMRGVIAWPAHPPTPRADHHIVSFVHQKRLKDSKHNDNLMQFDVENIRNDIDGNDMTLKMYGMLSGQVVEAGNTTKMERLQRLQQQQHQQTDDSLDTKQNTLMDMNALFDGNEHHESPGIANVTWQRNKQSIPVLATIQNLVNSLQNGTLNHTTPNQHKATNHGHHQLIGANHNMTMGNAGNAGGAEHKPTDNMDDNPAIETEEERVHAEESTEFKLLEVLGSFGSILWNFLMSIQKFFAASSGGASSSSSSQASASSSGGGAR